MLRIRKARLHYIRVAHLSILCTVQSHSIPNSMRTHMGLRHRNLCHLNTTLQQCSLHLRLLNTRNQGSYRARKAHFSSIGTDWIV